MNVVGDQSVMIALAWPYDPSLSLKSGATLAMR
jgi:hypothetical protein